MLNAIFAGNLCGSIVLFDRLGKSALFNPWGRVFLSSLHPTWLPIC
jgi:hypothetical protein